MSIKWMDGFGTYNRNISYIGRKWSSANLGSSTFGTGRFTNSSALNFLGTSLVTTTFANNATWTVGFAFQFPGTFTSTVPVVILQVYDTASLQVDLRFAPATGIFTITNGTSTLGTSVTALLPSTWYYIEMQVVCNAATGTIGLHINQVSDISVGSLNTATSGNAYANNFTFVRVNATAGGYLITDIYITNGSAPNATYLGDMKVETINPSAVGIYNAWTPNPAGSNYLGCVALGDNKTVSTDTAGAIDTYVFGNLAVITSDIKAVQEVVWAANSDSNTHSLKTHLDSSGTQYDSSAQTVTTTGYLPYVYIQETDPNTAVAWTVAGVNECQFGLNLVS